MLLAESLSWQGVVVVAVIAVVPASLLAFVLWLDSK